MVAESRSRDDANPYDGYLDDIVAAMVEAFKHATPEQVENLRRLFAPLPTTAETSQP